MILSIFTIHDSKAESYIQPFFAQNKAVAERQFTSACADEKSDFHRYAADYTLFHLGYFDQDACAFDLFDAPTSLGSALHFLPQTD